MILIAARLLARSRSALAVCMLFAAGAVVGTVRDPEEHFFDATFGDFTEELQNARIQGIL